MPRKSALPMKRQPQAVKEQAKLTKEKEMEVKKVETVKQAEIDKEKTVINAEAKKRETEINAEAAKAKAERDADAELILTTKKAEGSLITASKSAEGIKLEGDAKANAEKQMQLASVEAQLKLASEIGNNDGYQHYLIQVRQIEANEKVGLAQADNIKGADIKIIAGAGDVTGGISSAAGALSPKGGFNLAGMARFPRRNRRRQSPFGKIRIKNGRQDRIILNLLKTNPFLLNRKGFYFMYAVSFAPVCLFCGKHKRQWEPRATYPTFR